MILDAMEARPEEYRFFINLIKDYTGDKKTICEVLGFKLSFHQRSRAEADNFQPPHSLYKVMALLLQHKIINLSDIYPWVSRLIFKKNSNIHLPKMPD